jgi:hypothetical protein
MGRRDDEAYYGELEAGAEYLAANSLDAGERAAHLTMARVYRRRGRDAAAGTPAPEEMARS